MEWNWEEVRYIVANAYKRFNMVERMPNSMRGVYSSEDFIQIALMYIFKNKDVFDSSKGNLSTFIYNTANLAWKAELSSYSWVKKGSESSVSSMDLSINDEGLKLSDIIGSEENIEEKELYSDVAQHFTTTQVEKDTFNYIVFNEGTLTALGKKYGLSPQGFKNNVERMKENIKLYLGGVS